MIHKTYFSKDNTLYSSNPKANLGKDPILELTYGGIYGDYSRVIFDFDINEIKNKMKNMEIINNNLEHHLIIYNTYSFDKNAFNEEIPASFTLELFKIKEEWDEGNGYSLKDKSKIIINSNYSEQGSSFLNSKTNKPWTTTFKDVIKEIEFDIGRDSIKVNITKELNEILESNDKFYGFGLKYKNNENIKSNNKYNICFYGSNTHTFFKPYIESSWSENITDDRHNISLISNNNIMIYPNIDGVPVNLDIPPSKVEIIDEEGNILFESVDIKHDYIGIYSCNIDGRLLQPHNQYTDIWYGIKYNGINLPNYENEIITENTKMLLFNNKNKYVNYNQQDIKISLNGILHNEFINNSEKRIISVNVEDFFGSINKEVRFDLYIKSGTNKIFIIENEPFINSECNKFKFIDFSWFTPQQYFIDLYIIDKKTRYFMDTIKFNIISNGSKDKQLTTYSFSYKFLSNNTGKIFSNNFGSLFKVKTKSKD